MYKKDGVNIETIKVLNTLRLDDTGKLYGIDGEKVLLIDIREKSKYLHGHIPGAIHKDEQELYKHRNILKEYNKVYIYCDFGNTGLRATRNLVNTYGINNVYNIIGGYNVYRGSIEKG